MVYSQNVADVQNVQQPMQGLPDAQGRMKQMGKDFVVNAVANAPLAFGPQNIPAAGLIRALASLGAGAGMDKLINPQKTGSDIAGNAAMNTGMGIALPWLAEKMPNPSNFRIPGMRSETIREPTITERTSTSTGEGTSKGTSSAQRSGSSHLYSEGKAENNSIGSSSSERVSSGETASEGTSSGKSVSYKSEAAGPHTEMMVNLEKEIQRLKDIDVSKFNASARKQVATAISKNEDALGALNDANTQEIYVTDRTGSSQGKGTSQESSQASNTSKASSDSRRSGTSEGTSSGRSSGNSQRESTREGTSTSTSTTTPGKSTTVTTGSHWMERLIEAAQQMHRGTAKSLTDFQKFFVGLLPKTALEEISKD